MNRKKLVKIIIGTIVFAVVAIYLVNQNIGPKPLSRDGQFITKHEVVIKKEIFEQIDPERKHIHSITIQPSTARGKYEDGLGTRYQIKLQAFANDDKGYLIDVDMIFPNAEFGPFTFDLPDPYEDEEKYLSDWYIEADRTNAPQWKWKMEEEDRAYEEASRQEEARWEKINEETDRKRPHIKDWVKIHEPSLKKTIYDILLKEEPKNAQILGELESVKLSHLFYIEEGDSGCDVILELQFKNFPKEKAEFRTYIEFDDVSFQDLNQGGAIRFYSNHYNIEFAYNSIVTKYLDMGIGEIIIREVDNQEFRID